MSESNASMCILSRKKVNYMFSFDEGKHESIIRIGSLVFCQIYFNHLLDIFICHTTNIMF